MEKKLLALIQISIGYVWFSSSIHKIFVPHSEMIVQISGSLSKFSADNPHALYKNFLINFAIPNSNVFAWLVPWGEFLGGAVLLITGLLLLFKVQGKIFRVLAIASLVGLIFMNINFWFAAGWLNQSTASLNVLMFLIELILVTFWAKALNK
jgi:thiosulfate dehydrogenase [quinone] large subunit